MTNGTLRCLSIPSPSLLLSLSFLHSLYTLVLAQIACHKKNIRNCSTELPSSISSSFGARIGRFYEPLFSRAFTHHSLLFCILILPFYNGNKKISARFTINCCRNSETPIAAYVSFPISIIVKEKPNASKEEQRNTRSSTIFFCLLLRTVSSTMRFWLFLPFSLFFLSAVFTSNIRITKHIC